MCKYTALLICLTIHYYRQQRVSRFAHILSVDARAADRRGFMRSAASGAAAARGRSATPLDREQQEKQALAQSLSAKQPFVLFFRSDSCALCKELGSGESLESTALGLPVRTITCADDQTAWAPEVSWRIWRSQRSRCT